MFPWRLQSLSIHGPRWSWELPSTMRLEEIALIHHHRSARFFSTWWNWISMKRLQRGWKRNSTPADAVSKSCAWMHTPMEQRTIFAVIAQCNLNKFVRKINIAMPSDIISACCNDAAKCKLKLTENFLRFATLQSFKWWQRVGVNFQPVSSTSNALMSQSFDTFVARQDKQTNRFLAQFYTSFFYTFSLG